MSELADTAYGEIHAALNHAQGKVPADALPYLRAAAERITALIDESMAAAVLDGGASLRAAGAAAGLTENAVGPRLARTRALAAYANESGRVTADGVRRAQYDAERGLPPPASETRGSLRFKPRRRAP